MSECCAFSPNEALLRKVLIDGSLSNGYWGINAKYLGERPQTPLHALQRATLQPLREPALHNNCHHCCILHCRYNSTNHRNAADMETITATTTAATTAPLLMLPLQIAPQTHLQSQPCGKRDCNHLCNNNSNAYTMPPSLPPTPQPPLQPRPYYNPHRVFFTTPILMVTAPQPLQEPHHPNAHGHCKHRRTTSTTNNKGITDVDDTCLCSKKCDDDDDDRVANGDSDDKLLQ